MAARRKETEGGIAGSTMTHSDQINAFKADIEKVVDRYRAEFDLPYASAIGVLASVQHELAAEALAIDRGEEDE